MFYVKSAIAITIGAAIPYAFTSFAMWDLEPAGWDKDARTICGILMAGGAALWGVLISAPK